MVFRYLTLKGPFDFRAVCVGPFLILELIFITNPG